MGVEFTRMEEVANKHYGSLSALAKMMGFKKQTLYTYKNRQSIGRKMLDNLKNCGINPEYITTGEGEMLIKNKTEDSSFNEETIGRKIDLDDVYQVDAKGVLPMFYYSSNSGLGFTFSEDPPLTIDMLKFFSNKYQSNYCIFMNGEGLPNLDIKTGDFILFSNTIENLKEGDMVIVKYHKNWLIKRYHEDKGKKWLLPENDNYKKIELTEDIELVGIVTFTIRPAK